MADACKRLDDLVAELAKGGDDQPKPEALLFASLIRVYLDEEEVRIRQKLKRKSSQRISRVIHERIGMFLAQRLPQYSFHASEGLLFVKQEERLVSALKCIPDLGSYDTPSWNATIGHFARQYEQKYSLAGGQLVFVICSLMKSLDAAHVKELTGVEAWCGAALTAPAHRQTLQDYVDKCVEKMDAVPEPTRQLYFLSADTHPNLLADQLLQGEAVRLPDQWLRPSASELIRFLETARTAGIPG